MKKILLILLFSLTLFANSDSCKLDVYFGNGVWNDEKAVKISMLALKDFMKINNRGRFNIANEDTYDFKYLHNVDHGTVNDMIETFWQLYESGQISELYFSFAVGALNGVDNTNPNNNAYLQRIQNIIDTYNLNVTAMIKSYREDSLDLKHNVLLVAHSQGNLFGNQMYALLTAEEKDRFKMVSVATPANNVTGNYSLDAPYTTIVADYTIALVKNSFPGNAGGFGHTFVDSYLNSGTYATRLQINSDIINAVNFLDQNNCVKEYDYYRFISYICLTRQDQELVVDIYGTHINGDINAPRQEEYIASDVRVRAFDIPPERMVSSTNGSNGSISFIIPSGTGECPLTRDDFRDHTSNYDKNGCFAYTFTDTSREDFYCDPLIYDVCSEEYELDFVSASTYSSMFTCTTYDMSSDTQDLLQTLSRYH